MNGKRYPASYAENREAIRQALEANPKATNAEIARRFDSSRDTVIEVRRAMAEPPRLAHEEFVDVPLAQIRVGTRHRVDHGDIAALAQSIETIGLLHPIVVTPELELIAGERRLLACMRLQWESVPARVVNLESIVLGEYAENELRKDFTVSERVAIGQAIEAQLGNRQGMRTDIELCPNLGEVKSGTRSSDLAAERAGFGVRESYRKAKQVLRSGTPELIDALDAGHASIHAAATLAQIPQAQQRQIVARKCIRARKRAEVPEMPVATSDTPAFLPPSKRLSDNERVFKVTESIRQIATSDIRPEDMQALMKPFMWPAVTEFLDPAMGYLSKLKAVWRRS
ncbi:MULTISPECIES: ParB/RepB/Spo0J family partition protein [unclassified Caballeronia]|uniref:ParB/RepB/Spo0J family partition protein n=1 Tax=unclassified Caballeronia TaxID=2646786 RepID=UPI00285BA525|nr:MULTISPECIES: ParB/RepB/Spo0J family partition protein [unclassified Caballeronia]MDR5739177.1 ParB/RepB/Spo0J family partition protein [Caballeronia sp. LZ016]MDR5807665.1 ParB/RepB/Spo0J family partition protein [Caballeronia sp. LZ019]